MHLQSWPLFDALGEARSILVAGAGGGFDVYAGLPLYFALREAGKTVHLANLSFASLPSAPVDRIFPHCVRVTAGTLRAPTYFPEYHLSRWFREALQEEVPVYAFPLVGVQPLRETYRKLADMLRLDAVVLVDGGTDSLMRGDEAGLGTPAEDAISLAAVSGSGIARQFLACIGFGVDTYHGVCHAQFLESVASLTRAGAFLGVTSVLPQMEAGQRYAQAVAYANERAKGRESIVSNSIVSAIEGQFGDHHRMERTRSNQLWINPLMPIYWAFDLPNVIFRSLYLDQLSETKTLQEVVNKIQIFRARCKTKEWEEMPV